MAWIFPPQAEEQSTQTKDANLDDLVSSDDKSQKNQDATQCGHFMTILPTSLETLYISIPNALPALAVDKLNDLLLHKEFSTPKLKRLKIYDPFEHFDESGSKPIAVSTGVELVMVKETRREW